MSDNQLRTQSQDLFDPKDHGRGDWIGNYIPLSLQPYLRLMRLDRPIGIWLLLFPCWWAVTLAPQNGGWPDPVLMALMAAGAVIMRGAGCIINDIWDRKIDARVARTATRPLASGAISVRAAMVFLFILLLMGLGVLLALDRAVIFWGIAALVPVSLYPAMKRLTYWPQAFLGLTFNWGALLGWAAVIGAVALPAIPLYLGGVAWTLHYDTIYAHQDKRDDIAVGVKSTALKFGAATKPALCIFATISVIAWTATVYLTHIGWPGYLGVAGAACHFAWQIIGVDLDDPRDCLAKFRSNQWIGWILLVGFISGQMLG